MPSSREIIQSALGQNLIDQDGDPANIRLLPGLDDSELEAFVSSLHVPPPDDVRDLLAFCSGVEGALDQIDFTGRSLEDSVGLDFLIPHGIPIAHDGYGNFWIVDLHPGAAEWGPIYFCCHDAPVMLVQAATIRQFVSEVFKMFIPPHQSLIDDVHEDRLYRVARENPGVIPYASAQASPDPAIRAFAASLEASFSLIDLRGAPIGMGFSWGRYGPRTEVRRFGYEPIFAYQKPEKRGLLARLFGR